MNLILLFSLGPQELFFTAVIILLLFGGKKIPELMKGLGKGIREFNNAKNSIQSEINAEVRELDKPKIEIKEQVKVEKEESKA